MEWTKISVDLLQSRMADKEILSIVKYQLIWAMLEEQPSDDIALRYMTKKQLQLAHNYDASIEKCVDSSIKSVNKNRERQKIFYKKKQSLMEKHNGQTNDKTNAQSDNQTTPLDKIRIDNIFKNINNIYNNKYNINDDFKIQTIPEYEIYKKELGEEVLKKVEKWILEKKKDQVVDKEFICKQIINFSKRNGLI